MPRVRIKKLSKAQNGGSPFNAGSFNNSEPLRKIDRPSEKVNSTLKPIDREEANIEAEKGEVIISNFLGDGIPESYVVGGKRHNEGGTPLWAPENSFIFSDYKSGRKKGEKGLKINDPEVLKLFDIKLSKKSKKGITPAQIAKQYDLNKYKKQLLDPNSDHITQTTAEEMIANNVDKLGLLSLIQESMKGFPDGIPHLAIPFLQARGIDQQAFLPSEEEEQMAQQDGQGQAQPMQQPMEQPLSQTAPSPEMNMAAEPMMAQSGLNISDFQSMINPTAGNEWKGQGHHFSRPTGSTEESFTPYQGRVDSQGNSREELSQDIINRFQANNPSQGDVPSNTSQYDTSWEMPNFGISDKFQDWRAGSPNRRHNRGVRREMNQQNRAERRQKRNYAPPSTAQSGGNLYKAQPGVGINDNMEDELLTARQRRRENRRFNRFAAEHAENRFRESSEKTYWDDDAFMPDIRSPREEPYEGEYYYTPDSGGLRSYLWNKYDWYKGKDDPTTEINEEQALWDKLKESRSFTPLAEELNLTPKQVKEIEKDMETYFEGNKDLYTDGDYNFSRKNKRKFQSSQGDDPRFQWRDEDKRYDWSTFETDDNDWYNPDPYTDLDPTFKEGYWDQTRENWDNTLGRRPKNVFQRMKQKRDLNQILKNPNLYPQQNNQNQGVQFNVDDQGNIINRQSGGSLYKAQSGFDTQPTDNSGNLDDNYILDSTTNEWIWDPVVKIGTGTSGYARESASDPFKEHRTLHTSDSNKASSNSDYDLYGPNYNPTRLSKAKEYENKFNELNRERLKYVGLPGQTYIDENGDKITIDYDTRGSLIKNYDTKYSISQGATENWKNSNPYLDINHSLDKLDDNDPYYQNLQNFQDFYEEIDPDAGDFYLKNLLGPDEIDAGASDALINRIGPRQLSTMYAYEHDEYPCPPCPGETTSKPRNEDGTCPECDDSDTNINIPHPKYENPKFPKKEYWNQDIFRMAALAGRMPRKQSRDYVPFHFRDRDVVGLSPDQMIHSTQASEAAFNSAIRSTRGSTAQKQAQMLGNTKSLPAVEKAIADTANKNVTIFDTYERDMMQQNYNEETARQKNLDDYLADWNTIDDNHWKRKNIWKDSMANAYLDAESNALDTYYANMENPNFQIRPSRGGRAELTNSNWVPGQGGSGNTSMTQEQFIKQYKDLDGDPEKLGEAWAKYVTSLNKRGNMNNARSYNPFGNRSNYPGNRRRSIYDQGS